MIRFENLSYGYGRRSLFDSLSGEFQAGKLIGIIGPNGCGKTTFLKILAGLKTPQKGGVWFKDKNLDTYAPGVLAQARSYVPADNECHWDLTVEEFLSLGLLPLGGGTPKKSLDAYLQEFELEALKHQSFQTLSSGEKSCISLIRGMLVNPQVLFVDEILAHLYEDWQKRVISYLKNLALGGQTVVLVTHNLTLAEQYCDQLLRFGEGLN